MAPIVNKKRRRVEEEVRPKKKQFRNFKKQKNYHSSSEDEDDHAPTTSKPHRASDAPRPQPKHIWNMSVSSTQPKPSPKPILKRSKPAPKAAPETPADNSEGEEDKHEDEDELETNTALNAMKDDDESGGDSGEDNDEPDLDGVWGSSDEESDNEDIPSESEASVTSSQAVKSRKKRNDPSAFATSISKILDTKLSTSKRQDPVLSRSKSAAEANKTLADSKLEQKAKAQIRAEKRQIAEKGRVRDVLGLSAPDVSTGAVVEEEKRFKKTAQRGVVKLFNAVRAAQVSADDAMKQARAEGVVGMKKREERVNEMSKQGFLDLISSGGKQATATA